MSVHPDRKVDAIATLLGRARFNAWPTDRESIAREVQFPIDDATWVAGVAHADENDKEFAAQIKRFREQYGDTPLPACVGAWENRRKSA